ncbi:MAG: hypothetical protein KBA61_14820 [Spirochaetes bacterium]|nr:hypothetical protein [Spirochaetota bacterium]
MKKILILLMALSLVGFLACGDDEGEGQVSMSLSTEDGIENLGNIVPSDPSYAYYETDIAPWLDVLLIQAYANGYIAPRNQIMNRVVSKAALIRGEYLVLDVPSGRDLIFVVSAVDKNKVIQYSGKVGPVSVRPRSIVPLNVTLSKMIDVSTFVQGDSFILNLVSNYGAPSFHNEILRFNELAATNVNVKMYTQATYENDSWMPANPDIGNPGFFNPGASYNNLSQCTGGSFFTNVIILITVHVEDNNKGVLFYGARAYNTLWYPDELPPASLDVYMQHISRIAVRFNSNPGSPNVLATMIVNGNEVQLYRGGSFADYVATISPDNPVAVFSAPSGQEWFGGSTTVHERTVNIYLDTFTPGSPYHTATIPIKWGINRIDVP